MPNHATRRDFLAAAPGGVIAATALLAVQPARAETPEDAAVLHAGFPSQNPDLVRQAVGFSHGNIDGLRELLDDDPELAKGAWDWGFGDWETCLGAASHTGRVEIAELLLARGARPTLFSAAMLGQLDVLRALVTAQPGVQRTPGPHGITLLAHARAGGERAVRVVEYLESLGDADIRQQTVPLGAADRGRCVGAYAWGPGQTQRAVVEVRRESLFIALGGGPARGLAHHGELVFSPAGAPTARIAFDVPVGAAATAVRIRAGTTDLLATRTDG